MKYCVAYKFTFLPPPSACGPVRLNCQMSSIGYDAGIQLSLPHDTTCLPQRAVV